MVSENDDFMQQCLSNPDGRITISVPYVLLCMQYSATNQKSIGCINFQGPLAPVGEEGSKEVLTELNLIFFSNIYVVHI